MKPVKSPESHHSRNIGGRFIAAADKLNKDWHTLSSEDGLIRSDHFAGVAATASRISLGSAGVLPTLIFLISA